MVGSFLGRYFDSGAATRYRPASTQEGMRHEDRIFRYRADGRGLRAPRARQRPGGQRLEPQPGQGAGAGRAGRARLRRPGRCAGGCRAHPPVAGRRCLGGRGAGADRRRDPGRHLDRRPHHHRGAPHRRAGGALGRARPHLRACAGVHGADQLRRRHRADAGVGREGAPRRAAAGAAADDRQGASTWARRRSAPRPSSSSAT